MQEVGRRKERRDARCLHEVSFLVNEFVFSFVGPEHRLSSFVLILSLTLNVALPCAM